MPCRSASAAAATGPSPARRSARASGASGAGQLREVTRDRLRADRALRPLPVCRGDGSHPRDALRGVRRRGPPVRTRTWEVDVPAGIESGQRIRIAGAGHAGEPAGPAGDLYVQVLVAEDGSLSREGQDLVTVAELPVTEAMLGGTVEVPTLDGDREVDVPAGTQHGDQAVIRGIGLPSLRGTARGDQYVVFSVAVPANLSDDQRELVRRLGESLGQTPTRLRRGDS